MMASATGTQGKGDAGSPDAKPAFNERVGNLLSEFVGKPVTHALVNELTTRLGKQSGVISVMAEMVKDTSRQRIRLVVWHNEGNFVGAVEDKLAHLTRVMQVSPLKP